MHEAVSSPLAAWESFYVIVGSSAGALTGLMFVVITLVAESQRRREETAVAAFGTPTVVHFCAVLLISAILSAPWRELQHPGILLGIAGFAGVAYVVIVMRRARRQTGYKPVLEDWMFHVFLPAFAYGTIFVAGLALRRAPVTALFGIGTDAVLLLFIGIHNSWDTVTFLALERLQKPGD